ncbi:uncharacterized protein LOC143465263 isoform X1 [Clavelina lepadiformis]|uniref:uncharacterized protein LOC143465263 isoform X1 n=1 Tax=Clavelina lepadiformis TaxID=159417 RepID=UPI00404356B5
MGGSQTRPDVSQQNKSTAGPVVIKVVPQIYYDQRQYQDNREFTQTEIKDSKEINIGDGQSTTITCHKGQNISTLEDRYLTEQVSPKVKTDAKSTITRKNIPDEGTDGKKEKHVMISYNWDDKILALKIHDRLADAGYNVWIDKEKMGTQLYESMAQAVENSSLVLMFLSDKYEQSENCQREGKYAGDLKKPIIPIVTQANYKIKGWSGLLTAGKIYHDFSQGSYDDKFQGLLDKIKELNWNEVGKPPNPTRNVCSLVTSEDKAIIDLLHYQRKFEQPEEVHLEVSFENVDPSSIPNVNPRVVKVDLYLQQIHPKKWYIPSMEVTKQHQENFKKGEEISFNKLVEEKNKHRFILVVGNPGSGKTVFYKRLSKKCNNWPTYVSLNFKFTDIDYNVPLSLRELLIDKPYSGLSDGTKDLAWDWIRDNQEKCILLMDGLDQVNWSFPQKALPKLSYEDKMSACELVACIWNRTFLPDVFVIVTSRPHSALTIPKPLRPDATYYLHDLSPDDAKLLFVYYTGAKDDRLWTKIEVDAPHLINFCLSPLIVQFVARACLTKVGISTPDITSLSRVYITVFSDLQFCSNVRLEYQDNFTRNIQGLAKVSFEATKKSTVVISEQKLLQEGLDVETVQDLVIVHHSRKGPNSRIIRGKRQMHFSHQTIQECFAALYILLNMSVAEFRDFTTSTLFLDHWSMVRQFTCGLLVDITLETVDEDFDWIHKMIEDLQLHGDIANKRNILADALTLKLKHFTYLDWDDWQKDDNKRRYISLMVDTAECANDKLNRKIIKDFPGDLNLGYTQINSSSTIILSKLLSEQRNNLVELDLTKCFSTPHDVKRLISAIVEMQGKVKHLNISYNILSEIPTESFFAKIEVWLEMRLCFSYYNGKRKLMRDANEAERFKIQKILNQLENSKLKVHVAGFDFDDNFIILHRSD